MMAVFSKIRLSSFVIFGLVLIGINCELRAAPINVGNMISDGDFQALSSWAINGTANLRAASDNINSSSGNAGFDNFFSSLFVVLGDISGTITGDPDSGMHSISQTFVLPQFQNSVLIDTYDLTIKFQTVFEGRDDLTVNSNFSDIFSASLISSNAVFPLFSQNSLVFASGPIGSGAAKNLQIMNNPFNLTMVGLAPGTYTLSFVLDEKNGSANNTTNTAAGIDNVTITGIANPLIIPITEPNTFFLIGFVLFVMLFQTLARTQFSFAKDSYCYPLSRTRKRG